MQLKPYQIEGSNHLFEIVGKDGAALLADEMGLGKTAQAIEVVKRLRPAGILVVCPASLKLNWLKELSLWGAYELNTTLQVESYEWAAKNYNKIGKIGLLILDEAHYCKNRSAKRTNACLTHLWKAAKFKLLLTGTPCPNGLMDGWSLFNKLDPEAFPNKYKYGYRYCETKRNWFTGNIEFHGSNKRNLPELRSKLSKFMVRRKKKDVLAELPAKIFSVMPIEVNLKASTDLNLSAEEVLNIERAVHSESVATKRKAVGFLKAEAGTSIIKNIMVEKDRLVVFTYHQDISDLLKETLQSKDFEVHQITGKTPMNKRHEIVEGFQQKSKDRKQMLLAQIEAAGVGINLYAADTCIFFELDWVPAKMAQAIDRLHRLGQKSMVQIIYLVASKTLDEQIIDSLREKIEATYGVMQ